MFLHSGCKTDSSGHNTFPIICKSLSDGLNSNMPIKSVINCKKIKDVKTLLVVVSPNIQLSNFT